MLGIYFSGSIKTVLILALISTVLFEIGAYSTKVHVCPENEEYLECQSSDCKDLPCYQSPPFVCSNDCVSKCFCKPGYARNERQDCVKCQPWGVCPKNEEWAECKSPCNNQYCDKPFNATRDCTDKCDGSGCICTKGLRRNSQEKCVEC